jgi:hypothetical protein
MFKLKLFGDMVVIVATGWPAIIQAIAIWLLIIIKMLSG